MPTAIETRATVVLLLPVTARPDVNGDIAPAVGTFALKQARRRQLFRGMRSKPRASLFCFLLVLCRARFSRPGLFSVCIDLMAFVLHSAGHFGTSEYIPFETF